MNIRDRGGTMGHVLDQPTERNAAGGKKEAQPRDGDSEGSEVRQRK